MSFLKDIAEAKRQLRELETGVNKILPDVTEDAGKILLNEMRVRIRKDTTLTAQDLRVKLEAANESGAVVSVGPTKNRAYIAKYLEYGTRKMGKKPWMRPAADAKEGEIRDFIRRKLNLRIGRIQR